MSEPIEAPPPEGGERRPFKVVYTIVERPDRGKAHWVRIGAAFVNRDQSLSVRLDAHPANGTLHIRDYVPERRFDEPATDFRTPNDPRRAPFRAQNGAG